MVSAAERRSNRILLGVLRFFLPNHLCHRLKKTSFSCIHNRVVTKISSCRVNTTSRRGIKRLGTSFGSIFLLFSDKSSRGSLS